MIAVDTNVLVACHREEYSTHPQAVLAVTQLAEGSAPWAIPWPCLYEFLGIVTNPRIFKAPSSTKRAAEVVAAWMESPSLRLLAEGPGTWDVFRELLCQGSITGARVHDARIAALCVAHRVKTFWTADRDFSRFPALRCHNPLVG